MDEPILTISIPTYNRAGYLDKCLGAIFSQLDEKLYVEVEILISNNASTDGTPSIIEKYKKFPIRYIEHEKSIGGDNNLAYCFKMARGKYVVVFGDDDFLFPGTLNEIVSILKNNEIGVLHLSNVWYNKDEEVSGYSFKNLNYKVYDDSLVFFDKVNYWITFITANVINKKSLAHEDWQNVLEGTNFRQLAWTIPAIFKSSHNIFIEDKVLACKANNTQSYNVVEVFGKKLNKILDYYIKKGYNKKIKEIINIHLLTEFIPVFVKPSSNFKKDLKALFELIGIFWKYPVFWKIYIVRPLIGKFKMIYNLGR